MSRIDRQTREIVGKSLEPGVSPAAAARRRGIGTDCPHNGSERYRQAASAPLKGSKRATQLGPLNSAVDPNAHPIREFHLDPSCRWPQLRRQHARRCRGSVRQRRKDFLLRRRLNGD